MSCKRLVSVFLIILFCVNLCEAAIICQWVSNDDVCAERFANVSELARHIDEHFYEVLPKFALRKSELIECNWWLEKDEKKCEHASDSVACLKRHVRTHSGERPFVCDDSGCSSSFPVSSSLFSHKRKIHNAEIDSKSVKAVRRKPKSRECKKKFVCSICEFATETQDELCLHKLDMHFTDVWHFCEGCTVFFREEDDLNNHKHGFVFR